ncbi:MAG: TatD family hydrolase [Candidatus Doudnabacteria bacterium]|nr:TatD family hydrolase [Candidatus Doudnabacteria bacterium]
MIDSHCHLEFDDFVGQVDEVLARASAVGVVQMLTIGCSLSRAEAAIQIAQQHEQVFAAIGVHPETYGGDGQEGPDLVDPDQAVVRLRELAQSTDRVKAIGECGLDYHRPEHAATAEQQKPLLRAQLELARELGLPVVFHIREAFDDALPILADYADELRGVVHSFTGDLFEAKQVLEQGWSIGLNGIHTFGDASLDEVVQELPLDRILLETDAPFLTPVPHRGKRPNEPAHVIHVAEKVAELKGLSVEEVALATTENTRALFSLPEPQLF